MTEQQAEDLMLQIMLWETAEDNQHSINCLSALTALCRHRDFAVYYSICPYMMLQEGALLDRFIGMQVWQPGFEP